MASLLSVPQQIPLERSCIGEEYGSHPEQSFCRAFLIIVLLNSRPHLNETVNRLDLLLLLKNCARLQPFIWLVSNELSMRFGWCFLLGKSAHCKDGILLEMHLARSNYKMLLCCLICIPLVGQGAQLLYINCSLINNYLYFCLSCNV